MGSYICIQSNWSLSSSSNIQAQGFSSLWTYDTGTLNRGKKQTGPLTPNY